MGYSFLDLTTYPERRVVTPDIEVRSLKLDNAELRVEGTGKGTVVITGYAARFNTLSEDLGGFQEQLAPGAFDNALKTSDVRGLINHDANLLMGRKSAGTLRLMTNSRGLKFEIDPPDSEIARHYIEAIKRGDMTGCSFSFTTEPGEAGATWDHSRVIPLRTVTAVRDLFDVGPVTYPAYVDTNVAARSLEQAREGQAQEPVARTELEPPLRQRLLHLRLFFLKGK